MEILWLDGDICESWDDLLEHLRMIGEVETICDGYLIYKDVYYAKGQLIEVLKPLVELNTQLYSAWGLLYQVRDLPEQGKSDEFIPDNKCEAYSMGYEDAVTDGVTNSLAPIKEKIRDYLENPIGWREAE